MGSAGGTRQLRVAVVGAGLVARVVHLPLLRELDERFDVLALAEPDAGVRARVARRFAIPRTYGDHRDLIADGGLDAVLVCSPNATHARVTIDALEAGVHVLVEKPLAITLADADRIVAARDRTGLTVQVGYMKRFDPAYEAMASAIGDAGSVRHVTTTTYDPGLAAYFGGGGAPRVDPETAEQVAEAVMTSDAEDAAAFSNAFLGALVHDVNAVHGLLGRIEPALPLRVVDAGCVAGGRAATGVVELPGGARWFMAWMLLPGSGDFHEEIAVYAGDGVRSLAFPAPYLLHAPTVYTDARRAGGGRVRTAFGSWDEPYARQLVHFHECISRGVACRTPPEQARVDIELLTRLFERHVAQRAPA
jgi:predicted dehydrogenase